MAAHNVSHLNTIACFLFCVVVHFNLWLKNVMELFNLFNMKE